jgi:hypothetical protein
MRDLLYTFGITIADYFSQDYPQTPGKNYIVQKNKIDGQFYWTNKTNERKIKIRIKDLAGTANKRTLQDMCMMYDIDFNELPEYEYPYKLDFFSDYINIVVFKINQCNIIKKKSKYIVRK